MNDSTQPVYIHDQFYKVHDLSLETKIEIIEDAYKQNYCWWVDKLEYNGNSARQAIDWTLEQIMEKFNDKAHFIFIHRKGWVHDRGFPDPGDKHGYHRYHLEVGFRSMTGIDYFLWIFADESKVEEFVDKYNLEPL